jgi:hypothetical protein
MFLAVWGLHPFLLRASRASPLRDLQLRVMRTVLAWIAVPVAPYLYLSL